MLVPPQSVQVKLTTAFHTWIPAFQEGVDPEAHPVKPKRTEGLKTVKAYEQLEKLRLLTSKKATFKSLRLCPWSQWGCTTRHKFLAVRQGRERGPRGPEHGPVPGRPGGLWTLIMRTLGPEASYRLSTLPHQEPS